MKGWKPIIATAAVLYAALLAVTWEFGTREAFRKMENMLDYAVLDYKDTINGAIDTMLLYAGERLVLRLGEPQCRSSSYMKELAADICMDEINIVDKAGRIVATSDERLAGVSVLDRPASAAFMVLTNGTTRTFSQPFRAGAHNPDVRRKYLGVAFPGGNGYVQIGLDERHLSTMYAVMMGFIFDEWLLGETGFFLCADLETGRLISNPSRHRNEARLMSETGFVPPQKPDERRTLCQRIFGEKSFCREYVFAGHRLVAVLPAREYFGSRNILLAIVAGGLFVILSLFSYFIGRITADSEHMKSFYSAEEERQAKDLAMARTIQTSALPDVFPAYPDHFEFDIFARMDTAREVGGDFYDFFFVDATHLAFLVADVSGKGVPAAMFMMAAKTTIRSVARTVSDPAEMMTLVNDRLSDGNDAEMFVTAWFGVLDVSSGAIVYVNAGHNPPLVRRANGAIEWLKGTRGLVLAAMPGAKYKSVDFKLEAGDTLFLYTDGVTEATNPKLELFGEARLLETLAKAKRPFCGDVRAAVDMFAAGAEQADDMTMLSLEYFGPPMVREKTVRAAMDEMPALSAFLDEALAATDCPPAISAKMMVCLDEIASNVVKFSGSPDITMRLEYAKGLRSWRLTIVDSGTAWNPLTHVDPDITLSAEERPIGGLGILMVKKMVDDVRYTRDGDSNVLSMRVSAKS